MQHRSKKLILISALLLAIATYAIVASRQSAGVFDQSRATSMLSAMAQGVTKKDPAAVVQYFAPGKDIRVAGLKEGRIRQLLEMYFRQGGDSSIETSRVTIASSADSATMAFDLHVAGVPPGSRPEFKGRITLVLQPIEVKHLFGLYSVPEWRIVGGSTDQDLSPFESTE